MPPLQCTLQRTLRYCCQSSHLLHFQNSFLICFSSSAPPLTTMITLNTPSLSPFLQFLPHRTTTSTLPRTLYPLGTSRPFPLLRPRPNPNFTVTITYISLISDYYIMAPIFLFVFFNLAIGSSWFHDGRSGTGSRGC